MSSLVTHRLRTTVQTSGLVRKEVSQTLRQPQLLLLLVAGPFVILMIFGFGYDEDQMALRTQFVGPEDSIYQTAVSDYAELLGDYIVPVGYSSDIVGARRALELGEIDLVVAFPTDAPERLAAGEQAAITILHDKIDPIQLTAVEIASRLAVGEVNATILESLVDRGLEGMRPVNQQLFEAVETAGELERAAQLGDDDAVEDHYATLDLRLRGAETSLAASATVLRELDDDGAGLAAEDEIEAARSQVDDVRTSVDSYVASYRQNGQAPAAANLSGQVADLTEGVRETVNISPQVVVRPFVSDVQQLANRWISPTDFFAPSTIALLLAHLGVTFAAMSVVADRRLGVFEVYRVAPLGAGQVITSKYIAYLLLGGLVGAALLAAVVLGLSVPIVGQIGWVVAAVAGLLVASIGLGLMVSAFARTDSQAVQYAMLLLFAGLFFGGFFLDTSSFAEPVRVLSAVLPVTHGIAVLHDVMLRGLEPRWIDLGALGVLSVVYAIGAAVLTSWQLRTR
jgi:ABC-2 type transport system permease protein